MMAFMKLIIFVAIVVVTNAVGVYEQCAGEGYGTYPCNAGLTCFRRNKWFSSCQTSCPRNLGWECEWQNSIVTDWEQCGGQGWTGATTCGKGYACYARSVYYSQCRPVGDCPSTWNCYASMISSSIAPAIAILPAYTQCNNITGLSRCADGYACFRNTALYSECRPNCPPSWACQTDVAGPNQQCGGEGYVGLTRCAEGLRCYVRSKWYSHCADSCPGADWIC